MIYNHICFCLRLLIVDTVCPSIELVIVGFFLFSRFVDPRRDFVHVHDKPGAPNEIGASSYEPG